MVVPYYFMMTNTFKTVPELLTFPPTLYIKKPTLNNFYDPTPLEPYHTNGLFQYFDRAPLRFGNMMINTITVAVANTVIGLLLASMVAYVLAKRRIPGGNIIFLFILASFMIPWPVTLIPNYLTVVRFNMVNKLSGLIIPGCVNAFAVFFLRQYMLSIPDDLVDAARIDGCGEFRTWWQVVLPLTTPALTALAIFSILGNWNNFVWPLVIMQQQKNWTIPLAMASLSGFNDQVHVGAVMAGAMLASIPIMLMFLVFQKQFVENIAMTGIKG
jgi:ABC-type glycerol-3-phosphate transport system permease component